jgi:hypothetical protein
MTSISGGALGHFVFMTGANLQSVVGAPPGRGAPPVPAYCVPMKTAKPIRVTGADALLYQCADSSTGPRMFQLYQGHELLVWKDRGMIGEVSFHGLGQVNVDLDVAVADASKLVSPRNR